MHISLRQLLPTYKLPLIFFLKGEELGGGGCHYRVYHCSSLSAISLVLSTSSCNGEDR